LILTEFDAPDLEFAWADDRSADPAIAASIATDYVKCGIKTVNEARGSYDRPEAHPASARCGGEIGRALRACP